MAKIKIDDAVVEDYKKTAVKWNPTLLDLPIRAAGDVLKYGHGIKGLRGKMMLGEISADSQFAPFKKTRKGDATVDIAYREIETYLGNVVEEFSPVDYAQLVMGYDDPILGEKIKNASTTALVLFHLAKARGQHLGQAALTGKRNASGDTTQDLCDGWITIAEKEITAGKISTSVGNLLKLQTSLSYDNACDVLKEEMLFKLNQFLRRENSVLLCSTELADMYNESYLATHQSVSYNTTYNQPYLEGSANRITIIGLPEMAGQKHLILTQKSNLLWGTDNKSDESFVDVMRKDHYNLSSAANMWFGTQFHTIDPRRLAIIELKDYKGSGGEAPASSGGSGNQGGTTPSTGGSGSQGTDTPSTDGSGDSQQGS